MTRHQITNASPKPLVRALGGERQDVPPIWLMRQAGRYLPEYRKLRERAASFLDFCYTPALAVEATLQPLRRFDLDGAIVFADILLIADALGQRVAFREGEGPVLEAIRDRRGLATLDRAAVATRLAPVFDVVQGVAAKLDKRTALIGFAGAPWTVATYMVEGGTSRDHANVKRWAFGDPAGFGELIDLLTEATIGYLQGQIDRGAEVVQLFDTWAGALPAEPFQRWCVRPVRTIVKALAASHPAVPVIGFPRGCGILYRDFADQTGVAAVGLDSTVPLAWAAKLQDRVCVQGNLDPQLVVVGGEAMRTASARIVEALGGGPFVFNLGHGIVPDTPPAHVAELVDFVRSGVAS